MCVVPLQAPPPPWPSDPEGFGRLLEGCRAYLLLIANEALGPDLRRKVGASDLVQQTFLEAQRHFDGFRGRSRPELLAWLRAILECQLANARRRYHGTAKRAASREVPLDTSGRVDADVEQALLGTDPSPSRHAMVEELRQVFDAAIARLPDDDRQLVVWRHHEGRSFEEIGRLLSCSPEAARKRWSRAIQVLRRELAVHL